MFRYIRIALLTTALCTIGGFLLPFPTFAKVLINEIAWMGTSKSASDEWIELRNDGGAAVDLSGWILTSSDGSPSLALSGSIPSGGLYLIERTDDATVPDIIADLVTTFGSGLSNTGETLRLLDVEGALIDEVVGGEQWELVGGNNETKETAQRHASGWITAPGNPKAENAQWSLSSSSEHVEEEEQHSSPIPPPPSSLSGVGTASAQSPYPRASITAIAPADREVFAGMDVLFSGQAKGLYDESLPYATYHWTFGDGEAATGKEISHIFQFPGSYIAVLEVISGSSRATDRMSISVVAPKISLMSGGSQFPEAIVIHNTSGSEIDLSGWTIVSGSASFTFPPHTLIGKGVAMPISHSRIGLMGERVSLLFPNGNSAAAFSFIPEEKEKVQENLPVLRTLKHPSKPALTPTPPTLSAEKMEKETEQFPQEAAVLLSFPEKERESFAWARWMIGLFLLIAFLFVVTLYIRSTGEMAQAEQFTIVEDTEESVSKSNRNVG